MLGIQSLAAGLKVEPTWLLSNAELSRIKWRRGSHEGELIVEIETIEMGEHDKVLELGEMGYKESTHPEYASTPTGRQTPRVYTTVVGQYDDLDRGK